jgi:hypothetical protein
MAFGTGFVGGFIDASGTTTPVGITVSGIGIASLTKQLNYARGISASSVGVATVLKSFTLNKVFSAVATGVASLVKTFIPFVPGTGINKRQRLIIFSSNEEDDD